MCTFVEFVLKPFRQQICHTLLLLQMPQFFLSILDILAESVLYRQFCKVKLLDPANEYTPARELCMLILI